MENVMEDGEDRKDEVDINVCPKLQIGRYEYL